MKYLLIIMLVFWLFADAFSQIPSTIPRSEAAANASVADRHSWTAFVNPANAAFAQNAEAGIQYENRYLLKELSFRSLNFVLPTKLVNISLSSTYFGYSAYNEILTGAGFSRNFSNIFSIGLQFNYLTAFFAAQNRYRGALFPQIGLNFRLTDNIHLGFATFNPFQTNIKTEYSIKRIPSLFSLGADFYFSPELVARLQADKEISSDFRFAAGMEYSVLQVLTLKLGVQHLKYIIPDIGFGVKFGNFKVTLNGEMHPALGLNTAISLKYSFKK
jgi:hypothetical protein